MLARDIYNVAVAFQQQNEIDSMDHNGVFDPMILAHDAHHALLNIPLTDEGEDTLFSVERNMQNISRGKPLEAETAQLVLTNQQWLALSVSPVYLEEYVRLHNS